MNAPEFLMRAGELFSVPPKGVRESGTVPPREPGTVPPLLGPFSHYKNKGF